MNDRIDKIISDLNSEIGTQWHLAEDKRKFAEMIVRECAMLVEGFEITQEVALDEYVDYEASAVLKDHFGVE
jgi:hypothetical protein